MVYAKYTQKYTLAYTTFFAQCNTAHELNSV